MASFQAKKGWKTQRERETKNCRFVLFHSSPTCNRKFQKNSKKIQKYHYGIFQAKIDWKIPRKREYKNYRYVSFPSDA